LEPKDAHVTPSGQFRRRCCRSAPGTDRATDTVVQIISTIKTRSSPGGVSQGNNRRTLAGPSRGRPISYIRIRGQTRLRMDVDRSEIDRLHLAAPAAIDVKPAIARLQRGAGSPGDLLRARTNPKGSAMASKRPSFQAEMLEVLSLCVPRSRSGQERRCPGFFTPFFVRLR
jgi:hypothetical protein